jgi:hypothetical protein
VGNYIAQPSALNSDELIVYDEKFKLNNKDKLIAWAETKFKKIDDISTSLTWYMADACADCETLHNLRKSKLTMSDIKKYLSDLKSDLKSD